MSTVVIIGAGDLGGAAAQAIASGDRVRRVVLVDAAAEVAAGKALDIRQSGAVDGFHTHVAATDDHSVVAGAAACVVADRAGGTEWRGEEGLAMLGRVLPYLSRAPLVFAGTEQAELMLRAAREHGAPRHALLGSAAEAFASAARAIVAVEARCAPAEVMLAVVGAPGAFVVPWGEASIAGYALDRVLSAVQVRRIEARLPRLWPPGPYTLGMAAAAVVAAIATAARQRVSALTLLGGEFGVRNRIGVLPVLLNRHGVADVRVPVLSTRERVLLETALGS